MNEIFVNLLGGCCVLVLERIINYIVGELKFNEYLNKSINGTQNDVDKIRRRNAGDYIIWYDRLELWLEKYPQYK